MKKALPFLGLSIAVAALVMSCGLIGASVTIDANAIATKSKQGAPLFSNPASGLLTRTASDPTQLALAYNTFKDFDVTRPGETAAQGVDGSNLWVSLAQSLVSLQGNLPSGEDFGTPKTVTPTFNLISGNAQSYQYHGTSSSTSTGYSNTSTWAANINDTSNEMLMAYNISEGDGSSQTKTLIYLNHDSASGDLLLDVNYLVKYSAASSMGEGLYSPKVWVRGNTVSHSFEVVASKYGENTAMDNKTFATIRGAGTNTGTGEYMIIASHDWGKNGTADWTTAGGEQWFKVPAGAGVTEINALTSYASLEDLITAEGDPKDYGTKATALTPLTPTDIGTGVVQALTDFGNGNVLQF